MTKLIKTTLTVFAATILLTLFGSMSMDSAEAGCRNCVVKPVKRVCETLCVPEHIWEAVVYKRRAEGKRNVYWFPASYGCWNGRTTCVKRGKTWRRCGTYCGAPGSKLCYQDSVTKKRHVWVIDGVKAPPQTQ